MGLSNDDKDDFYVSGPTHLTQTIDWDSNEHRRCITACLVKGAYVLESDRTRREKTSNNPLAPAWWETFHFRKLHEYKLNGHIYGAVFEYAPPDGGVPRHPSAPSHIVAFRGTMPWDPTVLRDMLHNIKILMNKQHMCGRFTDARERVQQFLSDKSNDDGDRNGSGGEATCWLAGHSLGASIALDVGRDMMIHHGLNLPTFLFNPPHASLAPAIGEQARQDVYTVGYLLKYAMSKAIPSSHKSYMGEVFEKLTTWVPNVYVNPLDAVCEGYIHYFEERERMMERLPSSVATPAAQLSFHDMLNSVRGKQTERPHLLPSVILWKNTRSQEDAHGLRQWWQPIGPDLDLRTSKEYRFFASNNM